MVRYRRNLVPGGTYFFTVTLADRQASLLVNCADELLAAMRRVRELHPWHTDALVILPDHLHAVWTLPAGDVDYAMRWRMTKTLFTRSLPGASALASSPWQSRFWEHTIRDDHDLEQHLSYVHFNPVKHRLVSRPTDWRYSTIHRYIRDGLLPADWADEPRVAPRE